MLSREEILHIATLARVGLNEKDIERYQHDLSAVLDYFKKLEELDVENIEPIGHITGMSDVFRADRNEDFDEIGREEILANVPEKKGMYIKVKSVL